MVMDEEYEVYFCDRLGIIFWNMSEIIIIYGSYAYDIIYW